MSDESRDDYLLLGEGLSSPGDASFGSEEGEDSLSRRFDMETFEPRVLLSADPMAELAREILADDSQTDQVAAHVEILEESGEGQQGVETDSAALEVSWPAGWGSEVESTEGTESIESIESTEGVSGETDAAEGGASAGEVAPENVQAEDNVVAAGYQAPHSPVGNTHDITHKYAGFSQSNGEAAVPEIASTTAGDSSKIAPPNTFGQGADQAQEASEISASIEPLSLAATSAEDINSNTVSSSKASSEDSQHSTSSEVSLQGDDAYGDQDTVAYIALAASETSRQQRQEKRRDTTASGAEKNSVSLVVTDSRSATSSSINSDSSPRAPPEAVVYQSVSNNVIQQAASQATPWASASVISNPNSNEFSTQDDPHVASVEASVQQARAPPAGTQYLLLNGSADTENPSSLSQSSLDATLVEALNIWSAFSGNDLQSIQIETKIADLPDGVLAQTEIIDNSVVITLDETAAGKGWFVDVTPGENSEYLSSADSLIADQSGPAAGLVDLLTVVLHEVGHALGLDHDSGLAVMGDSLLAGERILPAGDLPTLSSTVTGYLVLDAPFSEVLDVAGITFNIDGATKAELEAFFDPESEVASVSFSAVIDFSGFVYVQGTFTLNRSVSTEIDIQTNLPASSDHFGEFGSVIENADMLVFTLSGQNVSGFVGINGPYQTDTDNDGIPDSDINEDAVGLTISNLNIAAVIMKADPTSTDVLIAPDVYAVRATAAEATLVGMGDVLAASAKGIEIQVNSGEKWSGVKAVPAIDFKSTYETSAGANDGQLSIGSTDPGFTPIILDFDGNQRLSVSASDVQLSLSDFVHVSGGFTFTKGPTEKVDIATGFPANVGDLIADIPLVNLVVPALNLIANTPSEDSLWIEEDLSVIHNLTVETLQVGATNVKVFIGLNGPYLKDLNGDGTLETNPDATGLEVNGVDLALVTLVPVGNEIPGLAGLIPKFTAVKATADGGSLVGIDEVLTASLSGIQVELNNGKPWPGGIGPAVVDFSTSFAINELANFFGTTDVVTVADVKALNGDNSFGLGTVDSQILTIEDFITVFDGVDGSVADGKLQIAELVSVSGAITASAADADFDGKLDPAGYEVSLGATESPIYINYDGNQRIGASVDSAQLALSGFVHVSGSLSFEKGPTHKVDVSTGLPANLGDIASGLGVLPDAIPTANSPDSLWFEGLSTIHNLEVDTLQVGASNVAIFVGIGGPYKTDTNGDGVLDSAPNPDAVGLFVENAAFGFVTMAPTLNSLPGFDGLLPTFTALKATADLATAVGMEDLLTATFKDIVIEVNDGDAWPADIGTPIVDFATSFASTELNDFFDADGDDAVTVGDLRALNAGNTFGLYEASTLDSQILTLEDITSALDQNADGLLQTTELSAFGNGAVSASEADNDGDGKIDPTGFEVRTGTTTAPVYLDYDGNQRIGASVRSAELALSGFVYISGSLSIEKGPTHRVDVATGLPANLVDIASSFGVVPEAIPTASSPDALWFEGLSTIHNLEVESLQIGASNVSIFVGLGGPYKTDTNGDGILDSAPNADATGVFIENAAFGLVTMTPTLNSLPGFEGILPTFTALKATADLAIAVGMEDLLTATIRDIVIEVNDGDTWPADLGPPVVDFATSFASTELVDFFDIDEDDVITVADLKAINATNNFGLYDSSTLDTQVLTFDDIVSALDTNTDGLLQTTELSAFGTGAVSASVADKDGDGKIDPTGFEVRTGTGTKPVYIDYDGNQRIGATANSVELALSEFAYVIGSLSFEKGPTERVDVATGLPSALNAALTAIGPVADSFEAVLNLIGTTDPGDGTLWIEPDLTVIHNVEVDTLQIGSSSLHMFVGLNGPYVQDTNGDGKVSDETVFNDSAVGFIAENVSFGVVVMNPTASAIPGLDELLPTFTAATASADRLAFVGPEALTMDLRGIKVEINSGEKWLDTLGPPVIDFSTSFAGNELIEFFDSNGDGKVRYKDLRDLGYTTAFGLTADDGDTFEVPFDRLLAIDTNDDGQLQVTEVSALGTGVAGITASEADLDGDGKLDPPGFEVRTGTSTAPVYITSDGNYRLAGSVDDVLLQVSDFVHVKTSFAFEKGPVQTVQLADGILPVSEIAALIGAADTAIIPTTQDEVEFLTIGAAGAHVFVGLEGPYWQDANGDGKIDRDPITGDIVAAEVNGDAVGLILDDVNFGLALMTPTNPLNPAQYYSLHLDANTVALVGIDDVTLSADKLVVDVNQSKPSIRGLSVGPVVDFEKTFESEQLALFDTNSDGAITVGELRAGGSNAYTGLYTASDSDTLALELDTIIEVLDTNADGVLLVDEAAVLVGTAAADAGDLDADGKIDQGGFEVKTGGKPVYLQENSSLIAAQGFVDLNVIDVITLTGNVAFELGQSQTITLTDGTERQVATMTIGGSNIAGFVGANGPYWTDTNGDQAVSNDELNPDSIGFAVTDLDAGLAVMVVIPDPNTPPIPGNNIFLAGKLSINDFGLVGVPSLTATGALEVEFNVGSSPLGFVPGLAVANLDQSFNEATALFNLIDTSGNGTLESAEINAALVTPYSNSGIPIDSSERLVPLLGLTPGTIITTANLLNALKTDFKNTHSVAIQNLDANGDRELNLGYEVNTGDPTAPIVLDAADFKVNVQLGGRLDILDTLRINGVFLFNVDPDGLQALALGDLEFGPDVGSANKIFTMNALGALVINEDGIAGDIDVSVSIGGQLKSVVSLDADARLVFNTTGKDQSITIPERFVGFMSGTTNFSELPTSESFDTARLSELGLDQLDSRFSLNGDGSIDFTIFGGAPKLDGTNDPAGAYFLVAMNGSLTLGNTFTINGSFNLKINGQGLDLGIKGSISLFGSSIQIEGGAVINSGGFAARISVGLNMNVAGGIIITGTGTFEINTSNSAVTVNGQQVTANTYKVSVTNATLNLFNVLTANGGIEIGVINGNFVIDVDARLHFFGLASLDIDGYINTNGTFSFTGNLNLDLTAGGFGIRGGLGLTLSNSGISGYGSVSLVVLGENIPVASARISLNWNTGAWSVHASGPASVYLDVTGDGNGGFSISGGLGLLDAVVDAIVDVANFVAGGVVDAANAIAGAAVDVANAIADFGADVGEFFAGVFSDIGAAFSSAFNTISGWFASSRTLVEDYTAAVRTEVQKAKTYTATQVGGVLTINVGGVYGNAPSLSLGIVAGQLVVDAPDVTRSVVVGAQINQSRNFDSSGWPWEWGWGNWYETSRSNIHRDVTFPNTTSWTGVTQIIIHGTDNPEVIALDNAITIPATVYGNGGDDIIATAQGNDIVYGGNGNDTIFTYQGTDELHGENGNDKLNGGTGNDVLWGGDGNDLLDESTDRGTETTNEVNQLYGENGNDTILGSPGPDLIDGGAGNDILAGYNGNDHYVFDDGYGADTYADVFGADVLDFSAVATALNITIDSNGFRADAGAGNSLVIGQFDTDGVKPGVWSGANISDLLIGTGNDTVTISQLPNNPLKITDAGGDDYYDLDLDINNSDRGGRIEILDQGGNIDRIDLDVDSTSHQIYLHPLEVLLNNFHLSFNEGIETLDLVDHAPQSTITTSSQGPASLLLKSGVTVESATGGDMEFIARNDFILEAGALIGTTGNVVIRGDNTNSGGALIDLQGTLNADTATVFGNSHADTVTVGNVTTGTQTTINTQGGNDIINLRTIDAATTVNTGTGADTVNVGSNAAGTPGNANNNSGGTVNGINDLLTINGDSQSGSVTINVDEIGDTGGSDQSVLTSTRLTGLGMASNSGSKGIEYHNITVLNLDLSNGQNLLTIQSTHVGTTNIETFGGNDVINIRTISGTTNINSGVGSDHLNVGSNANGTFGNRTNNSGGDLNGISAPLNINGNQPTSGSDVLTVDDTSDSISNTGILTSSTITGLGMSSGINYQQIEHLTISLGSGNDTFTINSTHGSATSSFREDTTLNTGAGEDRIHINGVTDILNVSGEADADTFNINATGSGSTSTLNGNGANDTFNTRAMNGDVNINSGNGDDTINVSHTAPDLPTGPRTTPLGSIDQINGLLSINGGAGSADTINIDDSLAAQSNNKTGTLTSTTLRGLELDRGINYASVDVFNLWLGYGDNVFDVLSTHAGETTVSTAKGADVVNIRDASGTLTINTEEQADTVNVIGTSLGSVTYINGHEGNDTFNLSDVAPSLPNANPEVGNIDGIDGKVVIDGGANVDQLNIDDSRNTANKAGVLTDATLRDLNLEAGVDYAQLEDFNLWLGTGSDTLYVQSTHSGTTQLFGGSGKQGTNQRDDTFALNSIAGVTTIRGQAGNDAVFVNVAPSGPVTTTAGTSENLIAANDAIFERTHENNIGALLNLHGQGGTDSYVIHLAGQGQSEINVHDQGLPNDGADRLVINGADVVDGVNNQPNDTFLLRKDVVALLNDADGDGEFDGIERVNYNQNINARVSVNGLGGDDKMVIDDNSAITTLDGGEGDDTFQIGQVFGTQRDANAGLDARDQFETIPVIIGQINNPENPSEVIFDPNDFDPTTDTLSSATLAKIIAAIEYQTIRGEALDGVAYVSNGTTYSLTAFGGNGEDLFNIYHNVGTLRLEGEADNDTFVVRAFVTIDLSAQGDTEVAGGGGGDTIQYAVNAPVSIDGGSGFDKVVVLGTPFNDTFVVTENGIFGAGLNVKFDNIESAELDTLEGNDTIYVLSTSPNIVTTVIGGIGDDTIHVGGDVTKPVISNDGLGRAGLISHGLTSDDPNYDSVGANGLGYYILDAADNFLVNINPNNETLLTSENGELASYLINLLSPDLAGLAANPVYLTISAGIASTQDRSENGAGLLVRVKGSGEPFTEAVVLTFDGAATEYEIEVKAINDDGVEGDRTAIISHSIISNNTPYTEQLLLDVFVDIVDNNLPGLDVRALKETTPGVYENDTRSFVLEGDQGIEDFYSVALSAPPAAGETVTVELETDDQLTVASSTTLTFNSSNWSDAQIVRVNATDDADKDGIERSTISHVVSSTGGGNDARYTTLLEKPASIEFVVYDDETPGAILQQSNGSTFITTDGTDDSYQIRLTQAPQTGTTVSFNALSDNQAFLDGTRVSGVAGNVDEYLVTFDSTNWSQWVEIDLAANLDFVPEVGQPVKIFEPVDQNLNNIRGPLIIEGGVGNGEDRTLAEPILLPGEVDDKSEQAESPITEDEGIDTLNIYHTDNADADVGNLFYRTVDGEGRTIANPGLALTGFEMGGDTEVDQGRRGEPDFLYHGGGLTINGFEIVELLLGKGNESLTVETTADRDEVSGVEADNSGIWAIHGGGGDDTITLNGRGEGALVVYGDTSEDGLRYSNNETIASENGTAFVNPGNDTIDARNMPENNDAFVGLVAYGGPGDDTIYGSQDNDQLAGGSGADLISGQQGNDSIYGDGSFTIDLNLFALDQNTPFGDDAEGLAAVNAMFIVTTTQAPSGDSLFGDEGNDIILGDHGVISQADGTRRILDTGNVTRIETVLESQGDTDVIEGGADNDIILAGQGGDIVSDLGGNNIVFGDHGVIDYVIHDADLTDIDLIQSLSTTAEGGVDQITTANGNDIVIAGRFGDIVNISGGNNIVIGDSGRILASVQDSALFTGQQIHLGLIETNTFGDGGADTINTGSLSNGNDIVLGGHEGDVINVFEGNNIVIGDDGAIDFTRADRTTTPGADTNAADIDLIDSLSTTLHGGADVITSGEGDDLIIAGRFGDSVNVLGGNNLVIGDSGRITAADDNAVQFGAQAITLGLVETNTFGDGGVDTINTGSASNGNDIVLGGHAGDFINVFEGNNIVIGDDGAIDFTRADRTTTPGADTNAADIDLIDSLSTTLYGGADVITSGLGDDIVLAGRFGDSVNVLGGNNLVIGDSGRITAADDDAVQFGAQAITLGLVETNTFGDGGVDTINTGSLSNGNDIVLGGHEGDFINVFEGNNIVIGDDGAIDFTRADRTTTPGADTNAADIDLIDSLSTTLYGGADVITSGLGDDIVLAGRFGDSVNVLGGNNLVIGDSGRITAADDNAVQFGAQPVTLGLVETNTFGDGGADTINTGSLSNGNDIVLGGHEGDVINVFEGNNIVIGDDGAIDFTRADRTTTPGADTNAADIDLIDSLSTTLYGGADVITSGLGDDLIIAGRFGDSVNVLGGNNLVIGDSGRITAADDNAVQFGAQAITLGLVETNTFGDGGADTINTGSLSNGNDIVLGGHEGDVIKVFEGNNIVIGDDGAIDFTRADRTTTPGADTNAADIDLIDSLSTTLYGGADVITSGLGDDIVLAGRFGDSVNILGGNNLVIGDSGRITAADDNAVQFGAQPVTLGLVETNTFGDGGADTINTGSLSNGNDIVLGGHEGDVINVFEGNNIVIGDDGAIDFARADRVITTGADTNAADIDLIDSLSTTLHGGADTITSGQGNDIVIAGRFGDNVMAGNGDNIVLGDSGRITAADADNARRGNQPGAEMTVGRIETTEFADGGADDITTGINSDIILAGVSGTMLSGDAGQSDVIRSGAGADIVIGDNGFLVYDLDVNADPATLDLVSTSQPTIGGSDDIYAGSDNDFIFGGTAGDRIWGDRLSETAVDVVDGAIDSDLIFGDHGEVRGIVASADIGVANASFTYTAIDTAASDLGGNDLIYAGSGVTTGNPLTSETDLGQNIILGQQGSDTIYGGNGDDDLYGGHNVANGSDAGDFIDGLPGNDVILGDNGSIIRSGASLSPRFGVLEGQLIYSDEGSTLLATAVTGENPAGVEARFITLYDHDDSNNNVGNFGDDVIAGGADDDVILSQLGSDSVHGDGTLTIDVIDALIISITGADIGGDDYIEGNGGNDTIYGGFGQDDLIGGSSSLFGLDTPNKRPDGQDTLYGGNGDLIARNNYAVTLTNESGDAFVSDLERHARDSDVLIGDNANVSRLVGTDGVDSGSLLRFNYDNYAATGIVVRAVGLLDYTPGGTDFSVDVGQDIGGNDLIFGEAGDDFIYGMVGSDILYGDAQNDDIIGGYGYDWISGGTGQDGILGDDGRLYTSRNTAGDLTQMSEPLYGVTNVEVDAGSDTLYISVPGPFNNSEINKLGDLKKTANLSPFGLNATADPLQVPVDANDIIYGGLGSDFIHGGDGDDAISGAEALTQFYLNPLPQQNVLQYGAVIEGEFAAYNENEPRRSITVDENGVFVPGSTSGEEFLLNFDPMDDPSTLDAADGIPTDGNDIIFGDLGHDWIVGGTGRDHLYGGLGDDLLNADDDHDVGGTNDTPDTAWSYEDIAFGGGGRDIMIANTGGDRLIDWAGEFNSYLVPFGPFGMGTVSRSPSPGMTAYLYLLGEADGADQTLGTDEARHGEPFGEMGLVKQGDPGWGDQTGGPADPQPGNKGGTSRDTRLSTEPGTTELVASAPADVQAPAAEPEVVPFDADPIASGTDPAPVDPSTTDPSTTDPVATDPVATDPDAVDPVSTEPAPTEPTNTDQVDPAPIADPAVDEPEPDTSVVEVRGNGKGKALAKGKNK